MSALYIRNQDRDIRYDFDPDALFYTSPVIHQGMCYGHNLMMDSHNLGTFETVEEAAQEVYNIFHCSEETYSVAGFSDWEGAV